MKDYNLSFMDKIRGFNYAYLVLISLYFSKYPYLLNLFSYDEIEKMLPDEITPKNYID